MKKKALSIAVASIFIITSIAYGAYNLGLQRGTHVEISTNSASDVSPASIQDPSSWGIPEGEAATRRHIDAQLKAGQVDPITGRQILYYHDPMMPGQKFEAPGKSPFMDMMLVPAYAGSEGTDTSSITVSSRIQQNIGLRTTAVSEGSLAPQISAAGAVAYNERDLAIVQSRAMGFVEKLYVSAALDPIKKGQRLVDLYVPSWVAAQEEFLSLRRMRANGGSDIGGLIDAARDRMRQVGMDEMQIRRVESSGSVQARSTILAPISGVAAELMVREGMTVMAGMSLLRINGLATVWVNAEIPESQAAFVRPGVKVSATTPAAPGVIFEGKVQALLPEVNASTRTIKARIELANPGAKLVPGMFAHITVNNLGANKTLLVPSESVIRTGKRNLVMAADEGGKFSPTQVKTGIESGGQTEILSGLSLGQKVVLSGQFLIDSEASLKGLEARLGGESGATSTTTSPQSYRSAAVIESIEGHSAMITHPEIAALKWPGMTMEFELSHVAAQTPGIKVGDKVVIEFQMQVDASPLVTKIERKNEQTGARK